MNIFKNKLIIFEKGAVVSVNDDIGIVVLTGEELGDDLDDHTGVWFGKIENGVPEVWTIPTEYLIRGPAPMLKH